MFYYQQEITPLTDEDFFILLNRYDVRFEYPVHFHSDYELNLVMETDNGSSAIPNRNSNRSIWP